MLRTKHQPQSKTGKRFCEFFTHRFNFIKSPYGEKPEWETVRDYPLEHRNLWAAYQDPERLIGLSFGVTTRYAVLDIDRGSPYHPVNSEPLYKALLGAYEEVGISRVLTVQSSVSGGLHIYLVFPKALPTYDLARMLRLTAIRAGYEVKDGSLEIFPNTKAYSQTGKTGYKPIRLPLQRGSYLLDQDGIPYSNDIAVFLGQAEVAAQGQDIAVLEVAIEVAKQIKQFRYVRGKGDACSFAQDLREQIAEGWTDFGQTNDMLRIIGTYGRVFEGLEGQELADYIVTRAEASPGYQHYCQHKHNIQHRAKDWGRCIEKYYYPYGGEVIRAGSFCELMKSASLQKDPPKENHVNRSRKEAAVERIQAGMDYVLQSVKALPSKVGEMKELLLKAISDLFGKRPSDKTLNKYKDYWHPEYIQASKEGESEQPEQEARRENPSRGEDIKAEPELEEEDRISPEKKLETAQAEELKQSHTPREKVAEIAEEKKSPKPLQEEESNVYAPPLSYMKVYELGSSAGGLLSRRVGSRQTRLKFESIPQGGLVRLCRGLRHTQHPEVVYVKPVRDAESWIGGIAVRLISLIPCNS